MHHVNDDKDLCAYLPVVGSGVGVRHTRYHNGIVYLRSKDQQPFIQNWRHRTSDICLKKKVNI